MLNILEIKVSICSKTLSNHYQTVHEFKKMKSNIGNRGHLILMLEEIRGKIIKELKYSLSNVHLLLIEHCVKSVRIRSYSGPHFSHIFPNSD